MADAEQVYRAHPTSDEIANAARRGWASMLVQGPASGSYEDAWLTGDE
jgi:hypothetical protein